MIELRRMKELPPALVGAIGSLGGVLIAGSLAGQEFFLIWALAIAFLLFALGGRFPSVVEAGGRGAGWLCGTLLRNAAGFLITIAWMDGPSPLALMTAFWAQRLFAEWRPSALGFLRRHEGEISTKLADLMPAACAFLTVMLPMRLYVEAPWVAAASIQ